MNKYHLITGEVSGTVAGCANEIFNERSRDFYYAEDVDKLIELVQAIIINRDKCLIPEDGAPEKLYSWTERAKEIIEGKKEEKEY